MKIGIVGLGLIGGCLGLDLRQAGHTVIGVSRRQSTCEAAIEKGAVEAASMSLDSLKMTEVVIVCTPINALLPTVEALAQVLPPETVITDVGSVKDAIVTTATRSWPNFVGGHPMAGKAESGIDAAELGLFEGRPYVITPLPETKPTAVDKVVDIATTLEAQIQFADPATHDKAVAWISHLPVMISASLIQACVQESDSTVKVLAQTLASSGFRDTSRVGGGNPELGVMMAQNNREALLLGLKNYRQVLDQLTQVIETEDWEHLSTLLTATQSGRVDFV